MKYVKSGILFQLLEERLYFEDDKIFKALKKEFVGIDGIHDDVYMNDIPNQEMEVSPDYHREKIDQIVKLFKELKYTMTEF